MLTQEGEMHEGSPKLRWGILGTGWIAEQFATDFPEAHSSELVAVASRDGRRAEEFAARHGARTAFGSYDDLVASDEIDVVYLALPNHLHLPWSLRAAAAGKQVLCEKPIALNARQAEQAFDGAEEAGVRLLEAFMYRMHPQVALLQGLLMRGAIGDVRLIETSFGGSLHGGYDNIRMQNASGGGAIMDLGCYGVSLSRLIAGTVNGADGREPVALKALAHLGEKSGVDEWSVAVMQFPGDIVASVTCGNQIDVPQAARIWGSRGHIELTEPWIAGRQAHPGSILIFADDGTPPETIRVPSDQHLFALEVDTFAGILSDGQVQAPVMDRADSLGNMRALDWWRREIGLHFAGEDVR